MKNLKIMMSLYNDSCVRCSTHVQKRDIATLKQRYAHEGLSFLTITLPQFASDFFRAIENKKITSELFRGWKKNSCTPAFLRGFTSLVFEQTTGEMYEKPSTPAILCIRQLCLAFKKVNLNCTDARVEGALQSFLRLEEEMAETITNVDNKDLDQFGLVADMVVSQLFNRAYDEDEFFPHHGPGSTAERITCNTKYSTARYKVPRRLAAQFCIPNMVCSTEECYNLSNRVFEECDEWDETPVRVVTVPKTQTAPRVIALEPTLVQMAQQGIKDYLVESIQSSPLTRGKINFSDQELNRAAALTGSSSGENATLDMKAASDMVHKHYVWRMFAVHPEFRAKLFAARSNWAEVKTADDTNFVLLEKFASMGSATTFPVEALYFFICTVLGILKSRHLPLTYHNVQLCSQGVLVYGDDIICPVQHVDAVVKTLHNFGSVVGLDKSFWKGKFRESCGMDAYDGTEVTPVYIRSLVPDSKRKAAQWVSTVSTANQLFENDFTETAYCIKELAEECLGKLPGVEPESGSLGWHFTVTQNRLRYNAEYQTMETLCLMPQSIKQFDPLEGYGALNKCLLKLNLNHTLADEISESDRNLTLRERWKIQAQKLTSESFSVDDHLDFSVGFGALTLKSRWRSMII